MNLGPIVVFFLDFGTYKISLFGRTLDELSCRRPPGTTEISTWDTEIHTNSKQSASLSGALLALVGSPLLPLLMRKDLSSKAAASSSSLISAQHEQQQQQRQHLQPQHLRHQTTLINHESSISTETTNVEQPVPKTWQQGSTPRYKHTNQDVQKCKRTMDSDSSFIKETRNSDRYGTVEIYAIFS